MTNNDATAELFITHMPLADVLAYFVALEEARALLLDAPVSTTLATDATLRCAA